MLLEFKDNITSYTAEKSKFIDKLYKTWYDLYNVELLEGGNMRFDRNQRDQLNLIYAKSVSMA